MQEQWLLLYTAPAPVCVKPLLSPHAIHTPLIPFDYVLRALDTHAWSKHRSKKLQLRRTKSLASIRGRTNRAVILNEKITSLAFLSDLSHVAFFTANLRQRR